MKFQKFGFAMLLVVALAGCGTIAKPGAPEQSFDIDQDIQDLENAFKKNEITVIGFYNTPEMERLDKRNSFIAVRLTLINIQYIKFIRRFAVEKAQLDSAVDILTIGVDLAITLVGGASTKAILGAVSAGLTSSKVSIDKNFFQEKTVPVLITAMNAERKKTLVPILKGVGKSLEVYSFEQALSDLHQYYQAGTFIGALQAVQKDSGVKETIADRDLALVRDDKFVEQKRQERVDKILDNIDGLSKDTALDLIQNLPIENTKIDKLIALRDPKKKRNTDEIVAKKMLKMAAVLGQRDDAALDAWEAAVKAVQ